MKYTRVEGREASLPVKSPGLHSLFYLRIQRSNKNTRKLRRTVNVSGEARLLAIIWLSVHMGNFCAVDRSIKYREQNQSEDINFHYRSRLSCSFADSCNFTIKANSSTFEEVIHTRHKLCHYAGLTSAH